MNILRAVLLATNLAFVVTCPVHAEGYASNNPMVHTSHLQPVQWPHSRPRIGIEDTSPIVTDWRKDADNSPLVIPIPTRHRGGAGGVIPQGAVQVGNGLYAIPASPGGIGNSDPMLGDRSYLQDAGPRSYVHQRPITAGRDLPMGTSTGVHSAMRAPHLVAPSGLIPAQRASAKPAGGAAAEPLTMSYREPAGSIGGASYSRTSTSTAAKILRRQMGAK